MRVLFAMLLCIAVVFQGFVYAHAFEKPCPVAPEMSEMAMGHLGMAGDCCNDADTVATTGELCKTGQACSPLGAFVGMPSQAAAAVPSGALFAPTRLTPVRSFIPTGIWRPPTPN